MRVWNSSNDFNFASFARDAEAIQSWFCQEKVCCVRSCNKVVVVVRVVVVGMIVVVVVVVVVVGAMCSIGKNTCVCCVIGRCRPSKEGEE